MKQCKICFKLLNSLDFSYHFSNKDRLTTACKGCINERTKKRRSLMSKELKVEKQKLRYLTQLDKDPEFGYKNHIKYKYGITFEDFQTQAQKQNNRCAICFNTSNRKLDIDHCHKTGKLRGLLCGKCNKAIGSFKDNIEIFENALVYLKNNGVWNK